MIEVYSPFKAAHHLDKIVALRNGELVYPTQIQIDLTNRCNHICSYCFSKFTINNGCGVAEIEKDVVLKLLDDAMRLDIKSFHYTGGGEPFLYKDIYEVLEKTICNGLEYGMVTNGTLIDFQHTDTLKEMSWIRISIDASDADMYKKLRGVDEFNKLIGIVKEFKSKCRNTVLGLSFVINPDNYVQIAKFAKLAKSLGVDNVRYSIAWFPNCESRYITNSIAILMDDAMKFQSKNFKIFNLTRGRLRNLSYEGKGYTACGYQHFTTVIGADGIVYPCCTMKYIKESGFGSIKDKSFEEVWKGEVRKRWLKRNHLKDVCSKHICWMEEKNKFIGYLTTKNPKHMNFV